MTYLKTALLSLVLVTGCATNAGQVRLAGQFTPEVPPPAEVRVLLDPEFGETVGTSLHFEGGGALDAFASIDPDPSGYFKTDLLNVTFAEDSKGPDEEPTFYLSFDNERDLLYAVGQVHSVFQYRTYDAVTKEESPRDQACWRITRGTYTGTLKLGRELMLFIGPNYDSPKHCLPEGNFTPGSFAPYKPHED